MEVIAPALASAMQALGRTPGAEELWTELAGQLYVEAMLAKIRQVFAGILVAYSAARILPEFSHFRGCVVRAGCCPATLGRGHR